MSFIGSLWVTCTFLNRKSMKCNFCEISNRVLPALFIGVSANTVSFLDWNPISPGHILIIPKAHYKSIFDCPYEILQELISETKRLTELIKLKLKTDSVNILNASGKHAQQSTLHLHFHIVPRFKNDNLNLWFQNSLDGSASPDEIFQKLTGEEPKPKKCADKSKKIRRMMPIPMSEKHKKHLPPSIH